MKYQVMPDLSPEDYAELKADIQARGVQVAVEYDESAVWHSLQDQKQHPL